MKDLDEIIEFENENSALDFKAVQYSKDKFSDLLKDLISMANANGIGDKYIITGIKHRSNGGREYLGISENFIDDATYQQLVQSNIEPEIHFKYFPYEFQDIKLGIFKIYNNSNPPYMMKKKYGNLNIGDAFIRKGSHQTRLSRKDFDYYLNLKISDKFFKGEIITYLGQKSQKSLSLTAITKLEFPSEKAEEKIRRILKEKKERKEKNNIYYPSLETLGSLTGNSTYEERSIETLEENLKNVKETYREHDVNYLFEIRAHKFNFHILNNGVEYLEDAKIEMRINSDNLLIADRIFSKPKTYSILNLDYRDEGLSWDSLNYPTIEILNDEYIITEQIGDLKHHILQEVFKVPIRIVPHPELAGETIEIKIKIYGKNLMTPIIDKLELKIIL